MKIARIHHLLSFFKSVHGLIFLLLKFSIDLINLFRSIGITRIDLKTQIPLGSWKIMSGLLNLNNYFYNRLRLECPETYRFISKHSLRCMYAHSITLILQLIIIINIIITASTTLTHLTRLVVTNFKNFQPHIGPFNPMFPLLCNLLSSNSNLNMLL